MDSNFDEFEVDFQLDKLNDTLTTLKSLLSAALKPIACVNVPAAVTSSKSEDMKSDVKSDDDTASESDASENVLKNTVAVSAFIPCSRQTQRLKLG